MTGTVEASFPRHAYLEIAPFVCPSNWLVTARSHLVDRFVADCERIDLGPCTVRGGGMNMSLDEIKSDYRPGRKRARLRGVTRRQVPTGRILYDVRDKSPANIAHFIDDHLPILFCMMQAFDLTFEQILIALPADIPDYICAAAEVFGLETWKTDDPVDGLTVSSDVWRAGPQIRAIRHEWVRIPWVADRLDMALAAEQERPAALPRRVFLSRRKTRTLENEAEVEAFLADWGFVKVYAEDFPVLDQFRLFREAEAIVAVHGAALAPLLYVPPDGRLTHLVELMPCGHMTNVYRVVSAHVNVSWAAVRGRLKPEYVRPAYDLTQPFKKYSLDSFSIDPQAIAMAFAMQQIHKQERPRG